MVYIRRRTPFRLLVLFLLLVTLISGCAGKTEHPELSVSEANRFVDFQVLAFNDFHGSLEARDGELGGAAYLASHLLAAEASAEFSITVSAGDLVGASPLISSLFHDEPSVEAANIWGLDYHAMGNHELDEGLKEMLRLQRGGGHPKDNDADGVVFAGANFGFLSANMFLAKDKSQPLPGYAIKEFDGIPIAIIGASLVDTLSVISLEAGRGLMFQKEAEAINRLVDKLRGEGVEAFIVLIHQGGSQNDKSPGGCANFSGDIIEVVNEISPAVDLFVTGHTHNYYLCELGDRPVTSAGANGRLYSKIQMRLDRLSGDMQLLTMENVPVTHDVVPNAELERLVEKYRAYVKPLAEKPVGIIDASFSRTPNQAGESLLGQLTADAQLEATKESGAQIAFMNHGGIRNDMDYRGNGTVTFEDIFAIHPFNNMLVSMTLTGEQLRLLLEQQWQSTNSVRILGVSKGFSYTWNASASQGQKVAAHSMYLDGVEIDPLGEYRITTNSFIAGGGDGFTVLREAKNPVRGIEDLEALKRYLEVHSPLTPDYQPRINRR